MNSFAAVVSALALWTPHGVTIQAGTCPGYAPTPQLVCLAGRTIYEDPTIFENTQRLHARYTTADELGYAYWYLRMDDAQRAHWARIATNNADVFADTYALCAIGQRTRQRWWTAPYRAYHDELITRRVLADTCWYVKHLGM